MPAHRIRRRTVSKFFAARPASAKRARVADEAEREGASAARAEREESAAARAAADTGTVLGVPHT